MSLQHFFLTRFNISSEGKEARIRRRDGWLDRRFELFERYCLPSVAGQTNRDFRWLIYFDAATPEPYRERIDHLRKMRSFEPLFVENFSPSMAAQDVAKRLNLQTDHLLTTRLDNDDAIARFFVAKLHEVSAKASGDIVFNFKHGLGLNRGKLYEAQDRKSPFTSLLEGSKDIRTIWHAQHRRLDQHWPVEQVLVEPAWLQVVHKDNVSNRIKGKQIEGLNALNAFAINATLSGSRPTWTSLLIDRLLLYPLRQMRELTIATAKRLRAF